VWLQRSWGIASPHRAITCGSQHLEFFEGMVALWGVLGRIGHPILFPNILQVGWTFQIRVPMDDTHTWHLMYQVYPVPPAPSRRRRRSRSTTFRSWMSAGGTSRTLCWVRI
jgi:hypothetical protein